MKRDFATILLILEAVENLPFPQLGKSWAVPDNELIRYNVGLLIDEKCITASPGPAYSPVTIERITWKGHDLLDELRNKTPVVGAAKSLKEKGWPAPSK
ncbi:MAG: DUF2513 domain-containing protein [Puniceicoccales bacterium]|jgi:hypothetical protein|nr:DUF2513 domain-containing protein [Puniceicoccales bacterium]